MRIPSDVTRSLKFQRDVPVCAHPTARLLSTAEKSFHPQLPLVSLSITEPVPEASLGRLIGQSAYPLNGLVRLWVGRLSLCTAR